jgi:TonB family protein
MAEYTLRSNWERPTDLADNDYVAEVEIQVDGAGRITGTSWKKSSGDARWDASVKKAIASTPSLNRPPLTGFPGKFLVRFDVLAATEPLLP